MDNYGILSLAPALIAVILAFITREALFSILCGVLVGLLITGQDLPFGFTGIIQSALGNADYIWVIGIEVFIGIMVAFFQMSGASRPWPTSSMRSFTSRPALLRSWALRWVFWCSSLTTSPPCSWVT